MVLLKLGDSLSHSGDSKPKSHRQGLKEFLGQHLWKSPYIGIGSEDLSLHLISLSWNLKMWRLWVYTEQLIPYFRCKPWSSVLKASFRFRRYQSLAMKPYVFVFLNHSSDDIISWHKNIFHGSLLPQELGTNCAGCHLTSTHYLKRSIFPVSYPIALRQKPKATSWMLIFPNACLQINSSRSPGALAKMTFLLLLPPLLSAVGRRTPLSNKQLRWAWSKSCFFSCWF